MVPSKMSTARFSTTQSHVWACRLPTFTINGVFPCTSIDCFVVVGSLGASRGLTRHLKCGIQ